MRKIITSALGITLIGLSLACGATSTESGDGGAKGNNIGSDSYDALKDAKITKCGLDDLDMASAHVEVTNHGKQTASYMIDVAFETPAGDQLATGTALVNDLRAGQHGQDEAGAAGDVASKFTCRITSVDRIES